MTGITSQNNVEVDGMPRHILDKRGCNGEERVDENDPENEYEEDTSCNDEEESAARRYPGRDRVPPCWML